MSAMLVAGAKRLGRAAKTSFAVVGFVGTAGAIAYKKSLQEPSTSPDDKFVLVLPFHHIKLVHKSQRKSLSQLAQDAQRSSTKLQELETQELVDLIQEAASDPTIVGLYGEFGHGRGFQGGAAEAEEIRNALRVFQESHRVHREPNFDHSAIHQEEGSHQPKPMVAYADTFSSLGQSSNPDYYLASMFPTIVIQKQGCLNLFGRAAAVPFFRQTLEKYGAKVHCYKHGDYKNMPNQFTHSGFTKAHKRNVQNYLFALNDYQCEDITAARPTAQLTTDLWKLIQNSGSFTPAAASKMGLMDQTVDRSPLQSMLTTDSQEGKEIKKLTLSQYRKKLAKQKKATANKEKLAQRLHKVAQAWPNLKKVLESQAWYTKVMDDSKTKETIALLTLHGSIDAKQWHKLSPSLEKIKSDYSVQCVVVRVDSPGGSVEASETILQELKALDKKLVVSFGNVAASGGYYVASQADQIFASKNTITGSIGVFGLRFDFSGAAAQYGVKFGHITTSDFAMSNSTSMLFSAPTRAHHANAIKSVGLAYERFRELVATGRDLSDAEVLSLAEGRVWTGLQAKQNGLVDEIGGLHRAIEFAKRNYTSGNAKVVDYGEDMSFQAQLVKMLLEEKGFLAQMLAQVLAGQAVDTKVDSSLHRFGFSLPNALPNKAFGIYLTMDENEAIRSLLDSGADETLRWC